MPTKIINQTISVDTKTTKLILDSTIRSYDSQDTIIQLTLTSELDLDFNNATAKAVIEYYADKKYAVETSANVSDNTLSFSLPKALKGYDGCAIIGVYVDLADGSKIDIKDLVVKCEPSIIDKAAVDAQPYYFSNLDSVLVEFKQYASSKADELDNDVITAKQEIADKVASVDSQSAIDAITSKVADVDSHATTTKSDMDTRLADVNSYATDTLTNVNNVATKAKADIANLVANAQTNVDTASQQVNDYATSTKADMDTAKTSIDDYAAIQKQAMSDVLNEVQLVGDTAKSDIDAVLPSVQAQVSEIKTEIENIPDIPEVYTDLADIKAYVGYTDTDVYGVEIDMTNRRFKRLSGAIGKTPGADFDSILAFGGRRRCNIADDGTVNAYYGDPGYIEDGSNGQVMVEQPKFYYKVVPLQLEKVEGGKGFHMRKARYYVSDTMKAGFKLHPAFIHKGKEKDFIYLSAYEGCTFDVSTNTYNRTDEQNVDFTTATGDKLSSIAGAKPTSGVEQTGATRNGFRKLANNRGIGWEQAFAATVALTQLLFTVEYASMNTQTAIGRDNVDKPSGDVNISYTEITGATTHLGNQSGSVTNENEINIVTYRGEENFWGNIWKWVDGLNIFNQSDLYVANHGFADDTNQEPYKDAGITLSKTSGYISAFGYNEEFDWLFFPSETKGDSALPVGDNFYQTTTLNAWRVARLGGSWAHGSSAGGFYWDVYSASSHRDRTLGGRLVYVPASAA